VVYLHKVMKELDTRQIIIQAAATRLNLFSIIFLTSNRKPLRGLNAY
jgi:hypothetical protein